MLRLSLPFLSILRTLAQLAAVIHFINNSDWFPKQISPRLNTKYRRPERALEIYFECPREAWTRELTRQTKIHVSPGARIATHRQDFPFPR